MENLPIDIHSNKLLEWLISRRHCPKNWQISIDDIRPKISHALLDMPENEKILVILSGGQYINYYQCKKILDILHETEKDTKNMFGFYSSQRIKDWMEIISMYERENVYLAEAAKFLQRFVQYEVPALRKQITKIQNTLKDFERKEQDYVKQLAESRRLFERELAKLGINCINQSMMNLNLELASVVDAQATSELNCLEELRQALAYFDQFSKFNGQLSDDMFPFLRLVTTDTARPPSEITVYEWRRHGKKPETILRPPNLHLALAEAINPKKEDEIDFGDEEEADIDFCTNGHDNANGIQIISIESTESPRIAHDEEAFHILEHPITIGLLLDELEQLIGFFDFRIRDEQSNSGAAGFYLSHIEQQRPMEVEAIGIEQMKNWIGKMRKAVEEFANPNLLQLLRIRTSLRFRDQIIAQLENKRRLKFKYEQMEKLAREKQRQCLEEIQKSQQILDQIIKEAQTLQENIESDISKRYNGREVYIMGEINVVLYGC